MRTAASAPYAARAIVLRVRPLGEKDRILELFGPGIGRWSAVARGSRGAKSKLSALSQPFVCARMLLAHGRSLDVLTQGEIENAHIHIPGHLLGAAWAIYWCEMLSALPERHEEDAAFDLLESTLGALDILCAQAAASHATPQSTTETTETTEESSQENAAAMVESARDSHALIMLLGHWFEARFLALLGFGSVIGECARCEQKIAAPRGQAEARVAFSPRLGGTLCAGCAPADPQRMEPRANVLRLLYRLERAESPSELFSSSTSGRNSGDWNAADTLGRSERELRAILRALLQAHLEIRPRSRRFLDDFAAQPPHFKRA